MHPPTQAASRSEKNQFYDDLQQALAAIPLGEVYVLLGDFNAQVGSRQSGGDPWGHVRGVLMDTESAMMLERNC